MTELHLVSFADRQNGGALKRLRKQASAFNFSSSFLFDETDLEHDFRVRHQALLTRSVRGFGYWVWKPQIILQALNHVNHGDFVLYVDSGCHLNPFGMSRFNEYLADLSFSPSGICAFQGKSSGLRAGYERRSFIDYTERLWTKPEVFDYFGVTEDPRFTSSGQVCATAMLFIKNNQSLGTLTEWRDICSDRIDLLDDSRWLGDGTDTFIDHRHDQSLFSMIVKGKDALLLSVDEIFFPGDRNRPDWARLAAFPIQARRDIPTKSRLNRVARGFLRSFRGSVR